MWNVIMLRKRIYGLTEQTFKARWNNHQFSIRNADHTQKTALSSHVWKCKNENLDPKITWSIKAKAFPISSGGTVCDLCLTEKLMADTSTTLNKRSEILEKCKHKRKFTLGTVKQTLADPEPPDPT